VFSIADIGFESSKICFKENAGHPSFFVIKVEIAKLLAGFFIERLRSEHMSNVQWLPSISTGCIYGESNYKISLILFGSCNN
jgi:hypothetical protein